MVGEDAAQLLVGEGREIEPEGLSQENWIPEVTEGWGTLILIGKKGASVYRPR